MIRKIAMTLLLAACIWPALAQRPRTRVEWGVIGGINIPDYTTNMSKTDVKNKLGWQAGIVTALVALTGSWRLLLPIYAGLTVLGGIWLHFTTVAEPERSGHAAGSPIVSGC